MKARFRVGCVPYVNARPLVACFDQPNEFVEVVYDVPSRLPALLDSGEVDAILVSSIEYLRREDLVIAADVGIMSNGPVASVRLLSKVPLEEIQTLALDESSMTSNMLAQIILAERGVRPSLVTMEPDQQAMLAECDACVLIGDKGLEADGTGLVDVDLGAAWTELTGLPFVWALWLRKANRFEDSPWYERDPSELLRLVLRYGYESSGYHWLHSELDRKPGFGFLIDDRPARYDFGPEPDELEDRTNHFESRRDWIVFDATRRCNWSTESIRNYLAHNVRFAVDQHLSLRKFAELLNQHGLTDRCEVRETPRSEGTPLIHAIYALNPGAGLSRPSEV